MKLGFLGTFCFSTAVVSFVNADDWARPMIETRKIDFGVIATGSEARKLVEISTKMILLKLLEVVNCESMRNLQTNHLVLPVF